MLVYGICTATAHTGEFEEDRNDMVHDNRLVIAQAEITFIGRLSSKGPRKSASTIIVGSAEARDVNLIIGEDLVW